MPKSYLIQSDGSRIIVGGEEGSRLLVSWGTFMEMVANPESEKIFLAELQPAEFLSGWALTDAQTYTYEISYLNEIITLANTTTENLRKEIVKFEEDGTELTEQTSIATVEANTGSWWHDVANALLYVHSSGDNHPKNYTMMGFFWLYFATKGIQLDGRYYEPYITERGVPSLTVKNNNIHWGVSNIGLGSLKLINNSGYFDQISKRLIWTNKLARLILGGDDLSYAQYETLFVGKIRDKKFTQKDYSLTLTSIAFDLLRKLPVNDFWISNYPNLEDGIEGNPIPDYYGSYNSGQAPVVVCIDTAYAADTYQFKICDHAIKSMTQVYVDYGDGVGWQTIGHANENLTLATFTIYSTTFVVGTTKVKVSFEGKHSGGTLIEDPPSVCEDILLNLCGYASADLNSSSFDISKARTEMTVNVPIEKETQALKIIEKLCGSDLAFFDEDGEGKLRYRTWEPELGDPPLLEGMDILMSPIPNTIDDITSLFWKIKVGYSYLCSQEKYIYNVESNSPSRYKYEKDEALTHKTYLRGKSDASRLGQRLLLVLQDPSPLLSIKLKATQILKTLGDKIKVTLSRASIGIAGGYDKRPFEIFYILKSFFPLQVKLKCRDLPDYSSNIGFWTIDATPDYSDATEEERASAGFWTDDDGYADPSDEDSLHKSRWW